MARIRPQFDCSQLDHSRAAPEMLHCRRPVEGSGVRAKLAHMSPDQSDEFARSRAMLKWPEFDEPFLAVLREGRSDRRHGSTGRIDDYRCRCAMPHRNRNALAPSCACSAAPMKLQPDLRTYLSSSFD
jgi:hypothetical protein